MLREAVTAQWLGKLTDDEAAAFWVARRAEGLTGAESALLDGWLSSDADHRRAFDRADFAWRSFSGSDDDEILAALRQHALSQPKTAAREGPGMARAAAALAIFVAGALIIALGIGFPRHGELQNPAERAQAGFLYASATGEIRSVALQDGSQMTLDTNTVARGFTGGHRGVTLERGRIFLAVRHDPGHPFVVDANNRRVVVVGTQFDVRSDPGGLVVRLFAGKILVEPTDMKAPPVIMRPGEAFVERGGTATVQKIDDREALSWRKGFATFDDVTLFEAASEMNRYSKQRIIVRDPRIAMLQVSGQFRAGDSERFVRTLAAVHPVKAVRRSEYEIEVVPAR